MVADIHPEAKIGKGCKIANYVYIEGDVHIGDGTKIHPFVYICDGVRIGKNCFIGQGVLFTNDKFPRAKGEWTELETVVKDGASIGAGAVILPGVTIGEGSIVGAGSVVTKDVPPKTIVVGNPARILRGLNDPVG